MKERFYYSLVHDFTLPEALSEIPGTLQAGNSGYCRLFINFQASVMKCVIYWNKRKDTNGNRCFKGGRKREGKLQFKSC
jgi:hypothetical protein